jgi:hypothetical protein
MIRPGFLKIGIIFVIAAVIGSYVLGIPLLAAILFAIVLLFFILLMKKSPAFQAKMLGLLKILAVFFGLPIIFYVLSRVAPPSFFAIAFIPVLIIYWIMVFTVLGKKLGIVVFLITLLFLIIITTSCMVILSAESPICKSANALREGWSGIWTAIKNAIGGTQQALVKAVKREIALATGDYYVGEVDENAQKRLGVFLEDIGTVSKKFYETEEATVYVTLKAETFKTDKPIMIEMFCQANKPTRDVPCGGKNPCGKLSPCEGPTPPCPTVTTLEVEQYEEEIVDCAIDSSELGIGSHAITFVADFNFPTNAYIKSYFMEKDRLRAYRRQEIDPLDEFGIEDKQPAAIYTQGPIGIGLGLGEMPIAINIEKGPGPTLGITLDNLWAGKLKRIKELKISVPKGIIMKDISPGGDIPRNACEGCEGTAECTCTLNEATFPSFTTQINKNVQDINTFRIHTEIINPQELLGTAPISIKNFKVSTSYDYSLQQGIGITVAKEPEIK